MYIIPAIDIKDGNCVRLQKGDYNTVKKVAENPYITAKSFKDAGARYLHMVDLDGAKDGKMQNAELICDIAKSCGMLVIDAVRNFGDKIIVGIDAMDGMVKSEGWIDGSDIYYTELAKRMEDVGVEKFIFTDISRDGMLTGPNLVQLEVLSNSVSADIVASGGVSDLTDIKDLMSLNIFGAICGKSIYEGTLNLPKAIKLTRG